ncbi:MAG: ribonuclease P protein component [Crocinitomicaceae bacterium]|nr:ribonuclease P protein component [Crocinitomicaceae bacterium]
MREDLGKKYKLCSHKVIEHVYQNGTTTKNYPFKLISIPVDLPNNVPFQIVFAVPKRNFKKAVDRNHVKRLMREAVRKHKAILFNISTQRNIQLALFLLYTDKEILPYSAIEHKIVVLFERLEKLYLNHE